MKRLNEIDGLVRSLQSGKDKGVKKLTDEVDSLKEQLARYEKLRSKGLDPEEAAYRMEVEQLLAERRGGRASTPVPAQGGGGSPTQPAVIDHTALLDNLGLDPNSPEVLAIVRAGGDLSQQVIAFGNLAAQKRAKPQPQPNPAQQVPTGGGLPTGSVTSDSLMRKYQELTKNVPPGQAGIQARQSAKYAIRKEADEAGVASPV